jgi:CBS domain-containing protein
MEVLHEGGIPDLMALQLHNGTVYRWNRACYGITDGKPHLRIENRVLPSGPTVVDEIANAVFWFGLVAGLAEEYQDVSRDMDFDAARHNFVAAARNGLAAQFTWLDGSKRPAHELILNNLLPRAESGLQATDVDADAIERYLSIIQKRVETQQTGAQWQLDSVAKMKNVGSRAERLGALTRGMVERQREGNPVHEWTLATLQEGYRPKGMQETNVEDYMTTELFTVHEEESVEFVARLMDWQRIRHVLVEDEKHRLVGLVSHRTLLRHMAERSDVPDGGIPVHDIMVEDPISISPEMATLDAVQKMREHKIGALPVVREDRLVGIITERDFIQIAGNLLDDSLQNESTIQKPLSDADE